MALISTKFPSQIFSPQASSRQNKCRQVSGPRLLYGSSQDLRGNCPGPSLRSSEDLCPPDSLAPRDTLPLAHSDICAPPLRDRSHSRGRLTWLRGHLLQALSPAVLSSSTPFSYPLAAHFLKSSSVKLGQHDHMSSIANPTNSAIPITKIEK